MINIEVQLQDLLYKAEIINDTTYTYLKLRSQAPVTPSPTDAFAIIDNDIGYLEVFGAMCDLAQKGVINFRFPTWKVQLYNTATQQISEAEVRRSRDTINSAGYIYNAIKAEQWLKYGNLITIDSAFLKKWNISTEEMIGNFLKVLTPISRIYRRDLVDTLDFTWNPEANVNPSSVSIEDLKLIKSQAGTSKSLYIFWLLQYQRAESGSNVIDLNAIARASGVPAGDFISALPTLKGRDMLSYTLDSLTLNWLLDINTLPKAEVNTLSGLFKPEALMAYKLKGLESNTVNVTDFCRSNALTTDTFYANLKKLKGSGILSYSAGECTITLKPSSNWSGPPKSSSSSSSDY